MKWYLKGKNGDLERFYPSMEEYVNKLVCLSNKTTRSVEWQNDNNEKNKNKNN